MNNTRIAFSIDELEVLRVIGGGLLRFNQLKEMGMREDQHILEWFCSIHHITRLGLLHYGGADEKLFKAHVDLVNRSDIWRMNNEKISS